MCVIPSLSVEILEDWSSLYLLLSLQTQQTHDHWLSSQTNTFGKHTRTVKSHILWYHFKNIINKRDVFVYKTWLPYLDSISTDRLSSLMWKKDLCGVSETSKLGRTAGGTEGTWDYVLTSPDITEVSDTPTIFFHLKLAGEVLLRAALVPRHKLPHPWTNTPKQNIGNV